MIERDAFQKRITDNKPLFVHEFFYPLMQGYDSVMLDVDLEIGGTDQTFNMLAGRTLLKRYEDKEKCVMTTTLLVNPKTNEKLMSKSLGTGVSLDSDANEMFGKTMALPDEGTIQCFIDCTRLPMSEVELIKNQLSEGANPKDTKLRLAEEIVTMYHSKQAAENAADAWIKQFSKRETPEDIEDFNVSKDIVSWVDLLVNANLVNSKSEVRRLIEQGAVKINGNKIDFETFDFQSGDILRVGKRNYIRLVK